jgi:hypothetical protein
MRLLERINQAMGTSIKKQEDKDVFRRLKRNF